MKSWKTSTLGISSLVALVAMIIKQLTDGDPSTNPDWNLAVPAVFAGLVGLFSRDNDKTSEDVGAK